MTDRRPENMIIEGEEVACRCIVGADVRSCAGDLRRAVRGRGSGNDNRADRSACNPTGNARSAKWRRRAKEEEGCPGEAEARRIEQVRGEDMLFLQARHLLAKVFIDRGERVLCRSIGGGVVHGVDTEEEIAGAYVVVEACGSEVFTDVVHRIRIGKGDAGLVAVCIQQRGAVLLRPEIEKRSDAGGDTVVLAWSG